MNRLPDDPIDPYELHLTRRVDAFADQAVRPVDAAAIAAAARTGARRQTVAGRFFGSSAPMNRIGALLAGALVVAVAFGAYLTGGSSNGPGQTANAPTATPTEVPGAVRDCAVDALTGEITAWEGAAGHRIATISLHNHSSVGCALTKLLRPALVDADGHALIVGPRVSDPDSITLVAGGDATTMVDMANYCGAAPTAQLKIRLYLPDQTSVELAAAANLPDQLDVPPCNGPSVPAAIQMQPFRLGSGS